MSNFFSARLVVKKHLTQDTDYFKFILEDNRKINFHAGQYLAYRFDNLSRLYSIFSPESMNDGFELVIRQVEDGKASQKFKEMKVGDVSSFFGPAGFFKHENIHKPKKMIAFGTGISPFHSMIKTAFLNKSLNADIELFWGLKTRRHVFLEDELFKISSSVSNFNYKICLSQEDDLQGLDPNHYVRGRITDHCCSKDINNCEYYICGKNETVACIHDFLIEKGVDKGNIVFENY